MNRLNVLFITQNDPLYVHLFFEEFFARYPDRREIRSVVIAPLMGKKRFAALVRQMYNFYGLLDFLWAGFKSVGYKFAAKLPVALPGRLDRRRQSFTFYPHPWDFTPAQPRLHLPRFYRFRHPVNLDEAES